jgi:hypothetical protein
MTAGCEPPDGQRLVDHFIRLIERGLLECPARGEWLLTPAGLKAAKALWPLVQRPSEHELAVQVAAWMEERPVLVRGRRARRSTTTTKKMTGGPWIEVEMDY